MKEYSYNIYLNLVLKLSVREDKKFYGFLDDIE